MQSVPADLPPSLLLWAAGLLQLVVAYGVRMMLGRQTRIEAKVDNHSEQLIALRITLTGEKGDNGIKGDVGALRRWRHEEMVPAQQKNMLRLQRLEDRAKLQPMENA